MAKFRIEYDPKICIGAAACAAICPEFWEMNGVGKAHLKGSKTNKDGLEILEIDAKDEECNRNAEESCPVQAIKIERIK